MWKQLRVCELFWHSITNPGQEIFAKQITNNSVMRSTSSSCYYVCVRILMNILPQAIIGWLADHWLLGSLRSLSGRSSGASTSIEHADTQNKHCRMKVPIKRFITRDAQGAFWIATILLQVCKGQKPESKAESTVRRARRRFYAIAKWICAFCRLGEMKLANLFVHNQS